MSGLCYYFQEELFASSSSCAANRWRLFIYIQRAASVLKASGLISYFAFLCVFPLSVLLPASLTPSTASLYSVSSVMFTFSDDSFLFFSFFLLFFFFINLVSCILFACRVCLFVHSMSVCLCGSLILSVYLSRDGIRNSMRQCW